MAFENLTDEEFDAALDAMSDEEINTARISLDKEIQAEQRKLHKLNRAHEQRDLAAHTARQAEIRARPGYVEGVTDGEATGDLPVADAS